MLVRIESADNNRIKQVKKLANKRNRDEENKIVIEGINLVSEAVQRGAMIDYIIASDEFDGGSFLQDCKDSSSITVCETSSKILNKVSDAENGVGILAVIEKPIVKLDELELSAESNILVLDRVQDPGNIGTMIRTAVAAGYEMVIAVKGTADIFSPKVLRATAGMIFDIAIIYVADATELKKVLRDFGKRIVVTTVDGGKPYYDQGLNRGIALVIGNEGNGVSDEVLALADTRVTIPMKGEIESLNAAVSAAILMYEAIRD